MNLVEIGSRIKRSRKTKHLTQESLAEKINVSPHYIYEIERGSKMMSLGILMKISQALCVSTDFLLFGEQSYSDLPEDDLSFLLSTLSYDQRTAVTKILTAMVPYLK